MASENARGEHVEPREVGPAKKTDIQLGAQGEASAPSGTTYGTSNVNPISDEEDIEKPRFDLKRALKTSFWSSLSFAPVLIAFNLILTSTENGHLIWNNLFGQFLFALAVMAVCLVVWTFIYGLFIIPISKRLYPEWWSDEESETVETPALQV